MGNGLKVQIWKDKWLPTLSTFRVLSPPNSLSADETVSALIDGDSKWWKTQLLESLFTEEEVKVITTIPISCTNQEDIQISRGTMNGNFSVRSAYYIQQELIASASAEGSSGSGKTELWKEIWGLSVPNVEKNFLWRACHDILPTRENLWKRKVISDPLCPVCGIEVETGFHILWNCPSAMDVWSLCSVKFQKSSFQGPRFMQVVEGVFKKCTQEELQQFVGIARRIWLRRNEVVHGGGFTHPSVILQQSLRAIAEFNAVHEQKDGITDGTM